MIFRVSETSGDIQSVIQTVNDIRLSQKKNIILLKGDLGAGKTTFVKEFIQFMGGNKNQVDSPTFSLLNIYLVNEKNIYHFDLYRIGTPREIEDIGFMEYIDFGNLCFVEWPEKITEFLPQDRIIHVDILLNLKKCREYTIS
ncbi:MAG: tRNA (adenosine(37)-N6)-threonylcarbamoyltransferase complex ATPase subunit type 1 TsaE [Bacteroidia bacterium]|nr:tRNA (adenosine(37)-N6)-threonylcarbamoyltransferase complex ATPase subunit type 1 TsaE [Bacteroidia bacterium]